MSAAAILYPGILINVWAFSQGATLPVGSPRPPEPQMAFYRKYTVALLGRYVRMSLEAGKVPSLLGQEVLRGKASSYRVESFEDVVIFLHDIEHCIEKLEPGQQHLITRLTLQEFTVGEVSAALGADPRTVIRRHTRALDALTRLFLDAEILTPPKHCQGGKN